MIISKQHFLNATAAIAMTATLFGAMSTFAGQPVSAASETGGRTGGRADFGDFIFTVTGKVEGKGRFSKSQMEKFNSLGEKERSAFIAEIIVQSIKGLPKEEAYSIIAHELPWCGNCKETKDGVQNKLELGDGIKVWFSADF